MWNLYTSRPRPLMWVWVAMRCFFVVDCTSSILTLSISLSRSRSRSRCVCVCSNWVLLKQLGGGEQGVCEGLSTRERRGNAPSRLSLNLWLGYGNGSFGFEWSPAELRSFAIVMVFLEFKQCHGPDLVGFVVLMSTQYKSSSFVTHKLFHKKEIVMSVLIN